MDIINYEYYILNPKGLNKIKKLDWTQLWIKKIDYILDCYNRIKGKYKIIDESIDYYIAMWENGLFQLKEWSNYYNNAFGQHMIIFYENFFDHNFYKVDVKERDLSEYIKYMFFKNDYNINYIYSLVEKSIDEFNYYLVVARLLFPSYYIYYLEKVFVYNEDYNVLEKIINRTREYEEFLKKIVDKINQHLTKKIVLPF